VGIDAANPGQFFSVNLYDTSTNEEPRPSVLVGMICEGAKDE
jgi:hypothetical protein